MSTRRARQEGAIYQRHDHPSCPPANPDGTRPEHRCQGRWVAAISLGWVGGKRQRRTLYGRTRKEVKMKMDAAEKLRSSGVDIRSTMTLGDFLTYWLDEVCTTGERKLKPNTMRSHRSKVQQYLIPSIGHVRLDQLGPEHILATYRGMRERGLSESTLRQTHAILRRALRVAMRERRVAYNAAEMMDAPGTQTATMPTLTWEEALRVMDGGDLRWWVALRLGLRQGEALALRWSDVDLINGTVAVSRALVRVPGEGLRFQRPKSASSVRLLPLRPEMLARFKVERGAQHDQPNEALIFPASDGGPRDQKADWKAWRARLAEVGAPAVPLHSARRTFASQLEAEGAPDRVVAQLLGHGSVRVTHGYQHADLDRLGQALGKLDHRKSE